MNTDPIKDWLARKTELAGKAVSGPWINKETPTSVGRAFMIGSGEMLTSGKGCCCIYDDYGHRNNARSANAAFIADSRTTTPLALEIASLAVDGLREYAELKDNEKGTRYLAESLLKKIQTLIES